MKQILFIIICLGLHSIPSYGQNGNAPTIDTVENIIIYSAGEVEQVPKFPKEQGNLAGYLSKNIQAGESDSTGIPNRKVFITFIVNANGKAIKPEVRFQHPTTFNPKLEASIIAAIEKMPLWKPGIKNNTAVAVRMVIPMNICF